MILLLFVSNAVLSQNTKPIDLKQGINIFKLNSSPIVLKNDIQVLVDSSEKDPNILKYSYVGNKITYLYNVKIKSIFLIYYKKSLMEIDLLFDSVSISDFYTIKDGLVAQFGESDDEMIDSTGRLHLHGMSWEGNKNELMYMRTSINPNGKWDGSITMKDKILFKKKSSEEF